VQTDSCFIRRMTFGFCAALAAAVAQSAETGFYLSGFGGQAVAHVDDRPVELNGQLIIVSPPGTSTAVDAVSVDRNDAAFGGMVGYRAGRFVAFEAMYVNLGESKYRPAFRFSGVVAEVTPRPLPPPFLGLYPGDAVSFRAIDPPSITTSTRGPALSALALWPVAEKFDVYGRAGVYFADTVRTLSFGSTQNERAESTEEALWGVGAQWRAFDRWSVRLDYHRFEDVGSSNRTGEADIELWSLGILFRI
jgi:opacity protein-like surface antigen